MRVPAWTVGTRRHDLGEVMIISLPNISRSGPKLRAGRKLLSPLRLKSKTDDWNLPNARATALFLDILSVYRTEARTCLGE
jgi:hypothetical protein